MSWTVNNTDHWGGTTAGGATNTIAHTLSFTPTDGSKLLLFTQIDSASVQTISSVSDGTNTFGQVYAVNAAIGAGHDTSWCYALDHAHYASPPTITVTWAGTATLFTIFAIVDVSGLATGTTSAILDGTQGSSSWSAAASATDPSYSSSASNEFLTQCIGDSFDGATVTAPSGYAGSVIHNDATNGTIGVAWKNSTGGSEAGPDFTWTGNTTAQLIKVAFTLPPTAVAPPPPSTDVSVLILRQYGLDAALQIPTPPQTTPTVNGTAVGTSAGTAYAAGVKAIPAYPPVIPAEFILAQFGLIYPQPLSGNQISLAGTANTTSAGAAVAAGQGVSLGSGAAASPTVGTATGFHTEPSRQAPVTPAELILAQYGLDGAFQVVAGSSQTQGGTATASTAGQAAAAGQGINQGSAAARSATVGFAAGQIASFVPPQPIPAEFILAQYGLDQYLQQPTPLTVTIVTLNGSANTTSRGATVAAGQGINLGAGSLTSHGAARAAGQGISLGSGVLDSRGAAVAAGKGISVSFATTVSPTVGRASPQQVVVVVSPAQVTPAELILKQFGVDPWYQLNPAPATAAGAPLGLPALVSPSSSAGDVAPVSVAALVSPVGQEGLA